jgi:ABC-type Fe3+ transport system substrate-binding protein
VAAGDSLWGFIDLDRAICAKRRDEPVHIFFPDRMGLGAITPPWVAALLSDAPNPPQARGLFAYLFSTETAWQLGQFDCALMSLLPNIPRPDWIPTLGGINVTQLDNQAVYDAYHDHVEFFDRWGD